MPKKGGVAASHAYFFSYFFAEAPQMKSQKPLLAIRLGLRFMVLIAGRQKVRGTDSVEGRGE